MWTYQDATASGSQEIGSHRTSSLQADRGCHCSLGEYVLSLFYCSFTRLLITCSDLHEETLEEKRADGLGGGQAHRTGENFRPTTRGPRRTRSVSPKRVGNTLKLGTRPVINAQQGIKKAPTPLPQYGMTARSVKLRDNVRAALDDSVIHRPFTSNAIKAQPGDLNQ